MTRDTLVMELHLLCFLLCVFFPYSFSTPWMMAWAIDTICLERLLVCPQPQKSRYIPKLDSICAGNFHILHKNSNANRQAVALLVHTNTSITTYI